MKNALYKEIDAAYQGLNSVLGMHFKKSANSIEPTHSSHQSKLVCRWDLYANCWMHVGIR